MTPRTKRGAENAVNILQFYAKSPNCMFSIETIKLFYVSDSFLLLLKLTGTERRFLTYYHYFFMIM